MTGTTVFQIEERVVLTPMGCAAILLRDFDTTERAIAYAEKISASAKANGNAAMSAEYAEAARLLRGYERFIQTTGNYFRSPL